MTAQPLLKDPMIKSGLAAIAISYLLFIFSGHTTEKNEDTAITFFFINYVLTVLYTIAVWWAALEKHKGKLARSRVEYTVLMLLLWFISAFALNRVMNVFDEAVDWLSLLLIISCVTLLLSLFSETFPRIINHLVHFFLGIALLLFVYYALYLVPLYALSFPASIAFGISLHSYIPLFLSIITLVVFVKNFKTRSAVIYSFSGGALLAIGVVIAFLISWGNINHKITRALNQNTLNEGKLPAWAVIAQSIPRNFVAERLIKADLAYKTIDKNNNWFWGGFPNRAFDEPAKHDPLVYIASLFIGKTNLEQDDRIKILKAMYDSRHKAQERLWSGDQLETLNIISNVKVFPEYRMAYTEKTLSIRNNDTRGWNTQQEAIYTFHLPEGSVVSSLSLWIEGKEEKAYLTTKSKADSAYKTIVGVEQRDPSVIHWQEGNTVSVRVFPCSMEEDRKFKIGVSSPLRKDGSRLVYENIYFDGPTARTATETLQLSFSQKPDGLQLPSDCEEISEGVFQAHQSYRPSWELICEAPKLSDNSFSFDNLSYHLKELATGDSPFDAQAIYLDLNNSWSEGEFETIWDAIKNKTIYVYEDKLVLLNNENKDAVFTRMSKRNFSLFPVYKIVDPDNALIISKSTENSPNFSDLDKSEFAERTISYLAEHTNIRFYNIGTQLSPYLKALKELRVFNYQSGSIDGLTKLIVDKSFKNQGEDTSTVIIDNASMMITEKAGKGRGSAPDHLLRLFAYNNIMKKVSSGYFKDDFIKPDVLAEAEKANIVTPVSSLIVLETQKDYERFGIEESKNSLKNASMKSSGAVPEPHEWLLILLTAATVIYLIRKPALAKASL